MIELKGAPVAKEILEACKLRAQALAQKDITPKLAIVRIGQNPGDVWYEKAAAKRMSQAGIQTSAYVLQEHTPAEQLSKLFAVLSHDASVHGILALRPIPVEDEHAVLECIAQEKDVDGACAASMAALYQGDASAFAPCTAEAVLRIADYYGFELEGANVVVCGRSLVVGKPVANLLLNRNATVSITHSKTLDMNKLCKQANLIVTARGQGLLLDESYVNPHSWVIDVATRETPDGSMQGDVDMASVNNKIAALTPVPGGVGPVTTAVLAEHVITAAEPMIVKG